MKTTARLFAVIFLGIIVFHAEAQKRKTKSGDVEAIKQLIEAETKAFFEIDKQTWVDSWAHVPYAFWSFADTTDVNSFSGWSAIEDAFSDYFASSKPSKAKIQRNYHDVRIYGDAAYVRFTQQVTDPYISRSEQAEVRVLEKIDGEWKIVHVGVIATKQPVAGAAQSP